ncbi:F-box domain, Leucine-rich repeat domain, L domain-like protein [Artemisia annua]|uniref:F-box domain, Leucine-rich repeat domain, L domain-like protein n=1 Tax=Artemisia annua TaxID=35608 RepID=A0A2U1MA06_ARTAN|nr:F-box domain, Leucine-rich repeat domain, L domain-like protein [Artemisia annua]
MDIINKPDEYDDSSSFSCLPDYVLLQVISNLSDLKTLCLCKLVSKRFHRIVLQVEAISFTDPLLVTPNLELDTSAPDAWLGSFRSVISSLNEFERVKSLFVQFPSSLADNDLLFKWKITFGNKVDSFIFLSPNLVYQNKELNVNANGHEEEEDMELWKNKLSIGMSCLNHATMRIILLLHYIGLPFLEKVSFTDSGKRGKVSISGKNFAEAKNELYSPSRTVGDKVKLDGRCAHMSKCYIPLLRLPVSGYVMKGVTLFLMEREDVPHDNEWLLKTDDDLDNFEDEEEAAYSEAMKLMFMILHRVFDAEATIA